MWFNKGNPVDKILELEKRLSALTARVESVELYTAPKNQYRPSDLEFPRAWSHVPTPIYSISLWEMIEKIRQHIGLEIKVTESKPATFELVKKK